jgi:hypothetical protein
MDPKLEDLLASLERARRHAPPRETAPDLHLALFDAQKAAWRMEVQPLSALATRFEQLAGQTAAQLKKQVRIDFSGFHLELAAPVHEAISVFLLHGIRNALDHGIETPEVRLGAGKSASGLLQAQCEIRSGRLKMVLRDDGAGVDSRKVGKDLEVLFRAGFSTAAAGSEVSGRGIGLSAIREAFRKLGGDCKARLEPQGGLQLEAGCAIDRVALEALPLFAGGLEFWLDAESCDRIEEHKASSQERAFQWMRHLGRPEPQAGVRIWKTRVGRIVSLGYERSAAPDFRLFRVVDPMFSAHGPDWLKRLMEITASPVLATRAADGSLSPLLDVDSVQALQS